MAKPSFPADLMLLLIVALTLVVVRVVTIVPVPTSVPPEAPSATVAAGWTVRPGAGWWSIGRWGEGTTLEPERAAERWHGDARRDLKQVAAAPWYAPIATWNDASGYGSLEAIRAAHGRSVSPSTCQIKCGSMVSSDRSTPSARE